MEINKFNQCLRHIHIIPNLIIKGITQVEICSIGLQANSLDWSKYDSCDNLFELILKVRFIFIHMSFNSSSRNSVFGLEKLFVT